MQRTFKLGFAAVAVLAAAACSDGDTMGPEPIQLMDVTEDVCTTIGFDGPGHMTAIGDISATELGLTLTTSGGIYTASDGTPLAQSVAPVAFFTQLADSVEDDDLQSTVPWGDCAACAGLGNIMTLPDIEQNPASGSDPEVPAGSAWASVFYGDYRWGGTMRIDGFTGGEYYVKSFTAVDQEATEGKMRLVANVAGLLGTSTGLGDGSVEVVPTSTTTFSGWLEVQYGTEARDGINGSGGIDDIVVCRVTPPPPSGEATRTPGYWKNDKKAWPLPEVNIGGTVYTRAQADNLMEHPTKNDKTYNMFEQLVATTLNLANGTEASCIASVVAEANTWMAAHPVGSGVTASSSAWSSIEAGLTMSASQIHTTLDQYNNGLLCAPHAD